MSADFWTGVLAGVVIAFLASFVTAVAFMSIVQRLHKRQDLADGRTWTGGDDW